MVKGSRNIDNFDTAVSRLLEEYAEEVNQENSGDKIQTDIADGGREANAEPGLADRTKSGVVSGSSEGGFSES